MAGRANRDGRPWQAGRIGVRVGGATGARTPDLLHAMQMLSQLSYRPEPADDIAILPGRHRRASHMRRGPAYHRRVQEPATDPGAPLPAWTIRRSLRARRARIVVGDAADVVVVLPQRAPLATAERMVREHHTWIVRTVARVRTRHAALDARRRLDEGRDLVVNGIPHTVERHLVAGRPSVRRSLGTDGDGIRGRLEVCAPDRATADVALDTWLRRQARTILTERVAAIAPTLAVQPTRISVRDTRSRWGSASPSGSLSFSWRLVLAPPWVLDTVVVHELAHLHHAHHGPAFRDLLRRHAPRADEGRRWLREHRHELRTALDDGIGTGSAA